MRYTPGGLSGRWSRSRMPSALARTKPRPSRVYRAATPGRSRQPRRGSGWYQTGSVQPIARRPASNASSAKTMLPSTSSEEASAFFMPSVELERVLVVLLQRRVLLLLAQEAVAHRERLDFGPHEAA